MQDRLALNLNSPLDFCKFARSAPKGRINLIYALQAERAMRWFIIANLLGLSAALSWYFSRRSLRSFWLLVVAPIPAVAFVILSVPSYANAPIEQFSIGLALAIASCFLAPALGCAAAYLTIRR
jgi:hypothetical protein